MTRQFRFVPQLIPFTAELTTLVRRKHCGHWSTPLYFLLATITGIYLGWLYWATGSLVAPVLAHALYDFIALVVIVRRQADPAVKQYPGGVEEAAGADAQPE